ncbi:MAG: glycosyltransferase [Nitrospirota bacterium]|nr:glycosyltransferase [Nitrospirota bacterium]
MNILMVTNTYLPHVGGVARSVEGFSNAYRARGHRVLVVAPVFDGQPMRESDVVRVPALRHFNGSDFSVILPVTRLMTGPIDDFGPDVIHSHHPFLLGTAAVRMANSYQVPLVFTHHTMYERYTHYVPGNSPAMRRFVTQLATEYANLCDAVFAPSASIAKVLRERGVTTPIHEVPTGVPLERFFNGDGNRYRMTAGIPQGAFVIGHAGRLAPEKNLEFLAEAVVHAMRVIPSARFLLIGEGPSAAPVEAEVNKAGMSGRLHREGVVNWARLADAYAAMDVFAFASRSETQGMVLTEAMVSGTPVAALDAPGVREVVQDGKNGWRLAGNASPRALGEALIEAARLAPAHREMLRRGAHATAGEFSMERTAGRALGHYTQLVQARAPRKEQGTLAVLDDLARMIATEWSLVREVADAAGAALMLREERRETG